MKPTEVRKGNLVEYDNRIFEIDSISEVFPTLNSPEFGIGVVGWSDLKPIKLTKEWLTLYGFNYERFLGRTGKYLVFDFLNDENRNDMPWLYSEDGTKVELLSSECENVILTIDYLHQLQNLYFTLTGKELK